MATKIHVVFVLLVLFQIKHFIADFPLQREYMLRKTQQGWDFLMPLATHCFVHGGLTLAIVLFFAPQLWWLALVDFAIHFLMDRIKSGPKYLGRFSDMSKPGFWNCLGVDQMVHHLTHIGIIWCIVHGV